MSLKCVICGGNNLKKYQLFTHCIDDFCRQYSVKYELDSTNNYIMGLFFDIDYQQNKYHIDYVFDSPKSLSIFNLTLLKGHPLIYTDELILTPYNFQKRLPTLINYS